MSGSPVEEVMELLSGDVEKLHVVVMPDFFLDRLLSLECTLKVFCRNAEAVIERKGGSIDGVKQWDFRGGNAANTASALAKLGVRVTPILCTDKLGVQLLKFRFQGLKVDLSHLKTCEKPSITTALEFNLKRGKANVMLRDVGSLADFSSQQLGKEDLEVIEEADYVCIFNWAGTRRFGTELAENVFDYAKKRGRGKTYYDTADPTPNRMRIPHLIKHVLQGENLDILSLNENEAICFAEQIAGKPKYSKKGSLPIEELAKESARVLASKISARVDLHTTRFSATFAKEKFAAVPAFKVPVLRATGAGDAWNAGNILGDAFKLSDEGRLTLANAVAAYYISDSSGEHPTREKLLKFCEKMRNRRSFSFHV